MTQREVAEIVEDRVTKWAKRLIEMHSTPFILIGFGHDHRQGMAVTCIEEMSVDQAVAYLEKTVELLKASKR